MIDEEILIKILDSREARAKKQKELLEKYQNSLISFTLNIPGREKDSPMYRRIFDEGLGEILKEIRAREVSIIYKEKFYRETGPEAFILIDMDSRDLKVLTKDIEDQHPLGRVFDIDVFNKDASQVSRRDLGLEARTCLLCNKEARQCMREKNHSYEELIKGIVKLAQDYFGRD